MDILIDATAIVNQVTGVGNYSLKLLESVAKIDQKNSYKVIVQQALNPRHPVFSLGLQFLKANIPAIGPKRQLLSSLFFRKNKIPCDIFHCLTPYLPLAQTAPSLLTVHGLTYLKYPNFLGNRFKFWYLKGITKKACQKADKIIAVSQNTKRDLGEILNIDQSKIRVVYEDSFIKKPLVLPEILPGLRKPYILYVGEKRPHKNLEGLVKAFYFFKQRDKWRTTLVLAGRRYPGYSRYIDSIKKLGLEKDVVLMDKVSDPELISLYCHADLFTLLSLYEGFGLPVLEAMNFGLPIVISNIGALTEIARDAAIAVNPTDYKRAAETILKLFDSQELRDDLVRKGFLRSRSFSWDKAAQETIKVYEEIYDHTKKNSFL